MTPFTDARCPWSQFELGQLLTCEERLCSWIRQPMNTVSNLGLVLAGVILLSRAQRAGSRTMREFGILALFIATSSALAHASQIRSLVFFDYLSQFILFAYLIALNWGRFRIGVRRIAATSVLAAAFVAPVVFDKRAGVPMFLVAALGYLASEAVAFRYRRAESYSALFRALLIFSAAALCFVLDAGKIICAPTAHLFQLHAVWHVLVAISLFQLARHYGQFEKKLGV